MTRYDDIINLPHHVSAKRNKMSNYDRAAQFAPYAALSGHGEAIEETARLTDKEIELSEDEAEVLNAKLLTLFTKVDEHPDVLITYFKPDKRKSGGAYINANGRIKKFDFYTNHIVFEDGKRIDICKIKDVEILEMSDIKQF